MKFTIAMLLFALAFTVLVKPAEAQHSFWHQARDQMTNRHGWQYGYGSYPTYNNYRGTSWGNSNPWGTYGMQQGWGHAQADHHEYEEHHGIYHHD
ncbi:MAG TPA: hypothetical protein V6C86_02710 [Oculatellaceae cyanobacterium]|jgi:hypothetical protein